MPYIGNNIRAADDYRLIDDISSSFNGSTTSFALTVASAVPTPFPKAPQQCLVSVNGVIQEPDPTGSSGFNLVGTNIVFSSAPTNGHSFFGIIYATADYLNAGGTFPAGSTGSPSITFTTDQDTGLYRKGSGSIGFVANSTEIANVDSNGITSTQFVGGGVGITGIAAGNIASGTIATARIPTLNQDTSGTAAIATTITVADESSNASCFPLFATTSTGNLAPKSGSNLTFNSSSGLLTATEFSGSGASLTTLNGSNISSGTVASARIPTLNQDTSGTAAIATTITVADESSDTGCFILFANSASGDLAPKSGSNLTFNSSSGVLTATGFAGALTGNVTGNVTGNTSGSSGSCTGNSATATTSTNVTAADESSDTTCFPLFVTAVTGNLPPKTGSNLSFNSSTGALTATSFVGSGANLTDVDAGATGAGSDRIFFENGQNVTQSYVIGDTFGAACNAMAAGPITINSGVTVTVNAGETLTIV